MATDGVKIIDGDLAHDTYWSIMDLYDSGVTLEMIRQDFPLERSYFNEFDQEIYVTVCALAFWEIGALTDEALDRVRLSIEKKAGIKVGTVDKSGLLILGSHTPKL